MMKPVFALQATELDYWVGRASGFCTAQLTLDEFRRFYRSSMFSPIVEVDVGEDEHGYSIHRREYAPSKYWEQAGPIMAANAINLNFNAETETWTASKLFGYIQASCGYSVALKNEAEDADPLVAAMRCFVMLTYGGEVDEQTQQQD